MSTELSLWRLIADASFLVQCIMLLLLSLSVLSWTLIFQYRRVLKSTEKACKGFEEVFWSGAELQPLFDKLQHRSGVVGIANVFLAGVRDYKKTQALNMSLENTRDHLERAMRIAIMRERAGLQKHLNWLATIGSVSPYIGLFGTVWGIMHAFISLGGVQQATLAMVAPGIAEALIATAIGLFAAIPAVVAYNRISNQITRLVNEYQTFGEEMLNLLQQEYAQTEQDETAEAC